MEVPWIIGIEIKIGNDIGMARQEGGLALKEMNHQLFIRRIKPKTRWQVHIPMITHLYNIIYENIYIYISTKSNNKFIVVCMIYM